MRKKTTTHASEKDFAAVRKPHSASRSSRHHAEQINSAEALQRALTASELSSRDILALQRTAGNRAVEQILGRLLGRGGEGPSFQSKPTFGPPGDPREQASLGVTPEAVNQLPVRSPHFSTSMNAIQRRAVDKKDLPVSLDKTQREESITALPDNLKAGIEDLSSMAMDDVKVHYNSSKPAQVQAVAYTEGTDIHVAPGQEKHVPHEAWHVVQQKQGRVKPTLRARDVSINDDLALEHEADVMGMKAGTQQVSKSKRPGSAGSTVSSARQKVTQLLSFSAALTDRNIAAPRTIAETDGGAQLALAGGPADLVEAGDVKESQNIGKALNQAADRFAEIGTKTNALLTAYNANNFAPRATPRTVGALEPFIYRIKVPYKNGKKTNHIELDYQLANPFYGYVVRQKDTGDAAQSVLSATGQTDPTSAGQVSTFNAQHVNTGPQSVGSALKQDSKKTKETNEARVDARAKLAGEGPRWLLVRNNYTTIADDSRIWTQHKDKVYSVSFRTLWLSWAGVFNYEFNIPDSVVADKLVSSTDWAVAPDVVKRNRWEAKGIDIKVHD